MIRVRLPDGRTIPVQTDDPKAAAAAGRRFLAAEDARKSPGGGRLGAATDNMTLGASRFVRAAGAAVGTGIDNAVTRLGGGKPDYSAGEAFQAQRSVDADRAAQFAKEHPIQSLASGVLGGFAMPGASLLANFVTKGVGVGAKAAPAALNALASGKVLAPTAARAATVGAGLGAVNGAATARPGEESAGAAGGAVMGGLIGGAIPVGGATLVQAGKAVGTAGRTLARGANKASGGILLNPAREATKRLAESLKRDGASPEQIREAMNQWLRVGGPSPALIDVAAKLPNGGQATLGLVRGAAMKAGPARSEAVKYGERVAADLQDNAIARTRALTPDEPRPAGEVVDSLKEARRLQAQQDYPAFSDKMVPVGDDITSATSGKTGTRWMQHAADLAEAERNWPVAEEIAALSTETPPTNMSAGSLDYIRRGMRDAASEAYDGGRGQLGAALKDRSQDLETALMDVDGFDVARNNYKAFSDRMEGVELGQGGLNAAPDQFAASLHARPEAASTAPIGYRQALTDAIGRPTEGATGVLNRISTSTNQGRNLGATFGEDVAGAYREAIGNTVDQVNNARFINPNTNSQTAGRLADEALVEMPPTSKTGIVLALVNKIRSGATLTDAERAALVRLGTGDPEAALSAAQPHMRPGIEGMPVSGALAGPLAGYGSQRR